MDMSRHIILSFIELGAAAMLDRASCDHSRERIVRNSLLLRRLSKSCVSVSRGDTEVAALLSARRVGKPMQNFVRSFIDVFCQFCLFLSSKVHLTSQMALRDRATRGFN